MNSYLVVGFSTIPEVRFVAAVVTEESEGEAIRLLKHHKRLQNIDLLGWYFTAELVKSGGAGVDAIVLL